MSNIALFEEKQVRRVWHNEMWYFSVSDVVGILSTSADPKAYWRQLKRREAELVTNCHGLKLRAEDGKMRIEDCANSEGLLRIIQSIPSPKADPFKRWLAKVGYERLQEIENPELAQARIRAIYKAKGYSDAWIEKRLRGIMVRDELTNEWKQRGVKEGREYAILTSEISQATFGMTPTEYKQFKNLSKPNENLRDHMTDLELIFTMLGEASTTEIARNTDALGFEENQQVAKDGGMVAGNARRELERKSGKPISSRENYTAIPEATRRALAQSDSSESAD